MFYKGWIGSQIRSLIGTWVRETVSLWTDLKIPKSRWFPDESAHFFLFKLTLRPNIVTFVLAGATWKVHWKGEEPYDTFSSSPPTLGPCSQPPWHPAPRKIPFCVRLSCPQFLDWNITWQLCRVCRVLIWNVTMFCIFSELYQHSAGPDLMLLLSNDKGRVISLLSGWRGYCITQRAAR